MIPRDFWIEDWERQAIIAYYLTHINDGYRRLTYMMLDEDIVAVSPSSVYRILTDAGLLKKWLPAKSTKGTGFIGPKSPHEHWHIDISYINICGTFYYLCCIIDGYSRYIIHWEIRTQMREIDVEIILQRALERFPNESARIISDNGSQFIAKDLKAFIKLCNLTQVFTSPGYPQSNGKIERWFRTVKSECIRSKTPLSLEDAKRIINEFVMYYNTVRLHSAIGYITPEAKLNGLEQVIFKDRDLKLEQARERRKQARQSKDLSKNKKN